METILKFDRVVLVKELNEKFNKLGEVFEIANILDDAFVLRDSYTRTAVGAVSFGDFERCFVKEEGRKGWTSWTPLIGFDGQNDAFYRTNGRKVQVKFLTDNVRAEASCNRLDDFNLTFGLHLGYLRCLNKALIKRKAKYEEAIKSIDIELANNNRIIKKLINSLGG